MDINSLIDKHKEALEKYREEQKIEQVINKFLDNHDLIVNASGCYSPVRLPFQYGSGTLNV